MAEAAWEEAARKKLDIHLRGPGFNPWLRDPPLPPIERWRNNEEAYSSLDLTDILGRSEYCHDFVRDSLRYYLHHIVHCEEYEKKFEENAIGLAQLINFVYYAEKRAESGEEILNEVLDSVITALSKFPRWIKVDLLTKVLCTGCPIYVAVRLFNGFDSPSEPLPRALLQSAAFTKDHFYYAPIREGYSVATRISGWGSNRLSNLGCHEGSSVDQKNMVTLPRFGGSRVTAFSVGVNHSLFLTENRQLFVTGRLKNWTGRPDDERIALTPILVELPQCSSTVHNKRYDSFLSLPNLQCRHIHAGANRSEIFFSTDFPLIKKSKREWDLIRIVAGSSKEPSVLNYDDKLEGDSYHILTNDRYSAHLTGEHPRISFKGSKKNQLDLLFKLDFLGGLLVSDSSKSLPRDLRVCVGNIVHRHHFIRQIAFCDNGDVFCLLQVNRTDRNYILVMGEIRKLRVDQMEWTSKKSNRDKNDEQYYLIAEQIAGAEHVVQFSVDRNGDNLLFEIRDQPRYQSFCLPQSSSSSSINSFEAHNDPEVCYGGATRSLELLQHERECGYVSVDDDELIKLSPHSNFLCPRLFLSEEMMKDLKEESPIEKRPRKAKSGSHKFIFELHNKSRNVVEFQSDDTKDNKNKDNVVVPVPDRYFGASFENGSLQLAVPRYFEVLTDERTKQYEDMNEQLVIDMIECYSQDLFPFHSSVQACITGRSDAFIYVTLRPKVSLGTLESEAKLRGFRMLKVTFNGEREFEIPENLWELHTPHFNRSAFHSSSMIPVVECPFPENLMRMCERAFIDPSSTENYSTNQLLNMLDVADYLCANLLTEDVIYRLLRNATRADINEILGEIALAPNSRSSLVSVLSRFPHILFDWPIDLESDLLFEACERMQNNVGPVTREIDTNGPSTIPSHCNLSLFILASPNCELGVGSNELPLSVDSSKDLAIANTFNLLPGENTVLNMINREDRLSLLFNSFKGDKGIMEKSIKVFDECHTRFDQVGKNAKMELLERRISIDLDEFLATVPSPQPTPEPIPREKPKRVRRHTGRKSEREGEKEEKVENIEVGIEATEYQFVEVKEAEKEVKEASPMEVPTTSSGIQIEVVERKVATLSLAEIIKEEEAMEASKKPSTPKRAGDGGKRSKFRPLSFSDSSGSTPAKNIDTKHDWTQSPRQETPKEKQAKSFTEIMKEQAERKSGVTRRRGPSVSGCQMEAAAIDALSQLYGQMVEDHQLVSVEVCRNEEEAPRWNADGDLYFE